jgi:raffinose/stachyose/melibiose transport system permease protein
MPKIHGMVIYGQSGPGENASGESLTKEPKHKKGINEEKNGWCYFVGILLSVFYLLPIYVLINMSFRTVTDFQDKLGLPAQWYVQNYIDVFTRGDLFIGLRNSLVLAVETVVLEIILSSLAAYGLARSKSKFVGALSTMNMLVMMIPGTALLVGTYGLMMKLHLTNSLIGLALLSAAGGIPATMFMYMNFIVSIPSALDEAAAIDGAGVIKTFFVIILPQLKAVTVTRIIMSFTGSWNNYLMPMYLLNNKSKFTVVLVIKEAFNKTNGVGNTPRACATAALGILPVIIIYLLLQKYIVEGQIDSAVK